MRVVVIAPPAPLVSLDEAKEHLRVLNDDEDAVIEAMCAAVSSHIDGPKKWLGRAIGQQTLEARFERFEEVEYALPCPDVLSVETVGYLDGENVEQMLSGERYDLIGNALLSAHGTSWPSALARREAIRVRYVAGYDEAPQDIKAAVLLMVGDLYAGRETFVVGASAGEIPMSVTVERLLNDYRVYA